MLGHAEVVSLLLEKGAKVQAMLCVTNQLGYYEQITFGETPLHLAARAGHANVVSLLLGKGADTEAKDSVSFITCQFVLVSIVVPSVVDLT